MAGADALFLAVPALEAPLNEASITLAFAIVDETVPAAWTAEPIRAS